jgi:hypothetical protein
LSSSCGGLLDWYQRKCSSSTSSVVASWVVFRLKHGGRQCWGVHKSERIPEHKSTRTAKGRQRVSESLHSPQKLWILLHVPSRTLL